MNLFTKIKRFFGYEAPYNWGASIDNLRHKIDDIDHRASFQIRGLSDIINKSFEEVDRRCADYQKEREIKWNDLIKKIDKQAAFFSDQLHLLEDKLAKLEKKVKKPKVKK